MRQGTAPTVQDLLAHASWVKALAARLVRDPHDADDTAQDAFVAALRHPPSQPGTLRVWIGRVVANLAQKRHESATARARREGAAAAAAGVAAEGTTAVGRSAPAGADVVARAELHRLSTDAVLALPEPYRSTVLARFFDGDSNAAIARREGVPDSTVRNRVARGVALLRTRLDERCGGRERWHGAVAAVAAPGAWLSPLASFTGAIVMTTLGKISAGAALVLLASGIVWLAWPAAPGSDPASGEGPPAAAAALAQTPPQADPDALVRDAVPNATQPSSGRGARSGRRGMAEPVPGSVIEVRIETEGTPVPFAVAHVQPLHDIYVPVSRTPWDEATARHQRVGADALARFAGLAPGSYAVSLELEGRVLVQHQGFTVSATNGSTCTFWVGSATCTGHVYRDDGTPAAGVTVQVGFGSGVVRTDTDASGAYAVTRIPEAKKFVGLEGKQVLFQQVTFTPGATVRVDFGCPSGLTAWTGALRTASGAVAAGRAKFHLTRKEDGRFQELASGDDGAFALRLEPGTWEVAVTLAGEPRRRVLEPALAVGKEALQRDLEVPGTRVVLTARVAAGTKPGLPPMQFTLRRPGERDPNQLWQLWSGTTPTVTFDGLGPGMWQVSTFPRALAAPAEVVIREGDRVLEVGVEVR